MEAVRTIKNRTTLDHANYQLTRKSDNERFQVLSFNNVEKLIWLMDVDNNRTTISMDDLDQYKIKSLM